MHVVVEACTGWLFVCDALAAAGAVAHLAEPVETRALRGRKRRGLSDGVCVVVVIDHGAGCRAG